jgi:hypothetical protein
MPTRRFPRARKACDAPRLRHAGVLVGAGSASVADVAGQHGFLGARRRAQEARGDGWFGEDEMAAWAFRPANELTLAA